MSRQTTPSAKVRGRPTLRTVAAETGLAVTTVSRALNDAPDIGAGTKTLVRDAAARVGYRPNRAGVRLRTGRTNVVSFVMEPETHMPGMTARLIHTLAAELRGTPYHLIVTPTLEGEDPLDQLRYLVETGSADVVLINKVRPHDPRIVYMHDNGVRFVTHGRSALGIAHPWYDFDNDRFAELAVTEMASRGRRHLLLVAPPREQAYAQHMIEGACRTAAARGISCRVLRDATSDSTPLHIEAAVADALSDGCADAVVCASISAAIAVVTVAEAKGRCLGDSIDLAAKEPFPFLSRFRPQIIAVRENADGAGRFLAQAALALIARPSDPPMTHLERPTGIETP